MTEIVRLEIKSPEHATKQPLGLRYALFCEPVLAGLGVDCISTNRMGHLGDFENYLQAKEDATAHPHNAVVSFYPDWDDREPSRQFMEDLINQSNQPQNPS